MIIGILFNVVFESVALSNIVVINVDQRIFKEFSQKETFVLE